MAEFNNNLILISVKPLTQREFEVLYCYARMWSIEETAEHLGISHSAVKSHRKNIKNKLV